MLARQIVESFRDFTPMAVTDETLYGLLHECEKLVYEAMNRCEAVSIRCGGLTELPEGLSQDMVLELFDRNGRAKYAFVGDKLWCREENCLLVYRPVPEGVQADTVLAAGELYRELYLYHLVRMCKLMSGDLGGYANFSALFEERYTALKRSAKRQEGSVYRGGVL